MCHKAHFIYLLSFITIGFNSHAQFSEISGYALEAKRIENKSKGNQGNAEIYDELRISFEDISIVEQKFLELKNSIS